MKLSHRFWAASHAWESSGCRCATHWAGSWPRKSGLTATSPALTIPRWTVTRCGRRMWPAPQGADSIVPVERTRSSEDMVEIKAASAHSEFVRPRGEDLRTGEMVMEPGKRLSPSDIGMLASLNHAMVDVWRRPRVSIVGTGDELVDIDQVPSGAQVVNSSAYALAAAVEECGGEAVILKVARDTRDEIRARLSEAAALDAVLSTGGVSAGDFDHVKVL